MGNFFKKFIETYKKTYEIEKELLMKKQDEQINSLQASVSMGKSLDEKKLLVMVKKYVTLTNHNNDSKKYMHITKLPFDQIICEYKKVN